jgi:predicted transposase/invertase (TIGR01784 family)
MSDELGITMPASRLDPLNFFLFEKLFGEKGGESRLLAFLKPLLARTGRELHTVEIVDARELRPDTLGDKKGVLDVRARMTDGTRCNIEVQRRNQHNMDRRTLFYWASEYVHSIGTGQHYEDIPDVICINLLDFTYINLQDEFHTSFHYYEDRHKDRLLTSAAEIHFVEIPKYRALPEKDVYHDPLHRWLSYLDIQTPMPLVKEILEMDSTIAETQKVVDFVSQNEAMLHAYLLEQMTIMDEASWLQEAREEGREEGKEERDIEHARNFLAMGLPPEQVAEGTGLPLDIVIKLRDKK